MALPKERASSNESATPVCLIIDPVSDDPSASAWDVLASVLGLPSRDSVRAACWHVDIEGNGYFGTDDVESSCYSFQLAADSPGESAEVELYFSVFIQGETEDWEVTFENPSDLATLQGLFDEKDSSINIQADSSLLAYQAYRSALSQQPGRVKDWALVPKLHMGSELITLMGNWIEGGGREFDRVHYVFWMLEGRSHEIWQYLQDNDRSLAKAMVTALMELLSAEFSGFRGSAAHGRGSPKYLQWSTARKSLGKELKWLRTVQ